MAIYHCSVKKIGRSAGRSAVAAAAYRAGDCLVDDDTGVVCDYSHKRGVIYSEIDLPEHAPESYRDRGTLWNAVQKVECKSNSVLAREIEVALPREFDLQTQIGAVSEFVKNTCVDKGMIADWSIHDTGKGNPHAHIMLTVRPLKEDGSWDYKERKVIKLDENGERVPLIDPETGEQKIRVRTRNGITSHEKMWVHETVLANGFDKKELIEEWRAAWADVCNIRLETLGADPIDHRSYKRQGIDLEPTIHEGTAARQMEAKGVETDVCGQNREIMERRSVLAAISEKIADVVQKIGIFEKVKDLIEGREKVQRDLERRAEDGRIESGGDRDRGSSDAYRSAGRDDVSERGIEPGEWRTKTAAGNVEKSGFRSEYGDDRMATEGKSGIDRGYRAAAGRIEAEGRRDREKGTDCQIDQGV